jgi:hypothetical protein
MSVLLIKVVCGGRVTVTECKWKMHGSHKLTHQRSGPQEIFAIGHMPFVIYGPETALSAGHTLLDSAGITLPSPRIGMPIVSQEHRVPVCGLKG